MKRTEVPKLQRRMELPTDLTPPRIRRRIGLQYFFSSDDDVVPVDDAATRYDPGVWYDPFFLYDLCPMKMLLSSILPPTPVTHDTHKMFQGRWLLMELWPIRRPLGFVWLNEHMLMYLHPLRPLRHLHLKGRGVFKCLYVHRHKWFSRKVLMFLHQTSHYLTVPVHIHREAGLQQSQEDKIKVS